MVIGNLTSSASQGYGGVRLLANQDRLPAKDRVSSASQERAPVTLDAELNPANPNEYSVTPAAPSISPPERVGDTKSLDKQRAGQPGDSANLEEDFESSTRARANQNRDPVSRAFLSIANYAPRPHKIDIQV